MIDSRTLIPIGCLLVTGVLGLAQTPAVAPVPPAAPTAPSAAAPPTPARAPRARALTVAPDDAEFLREIARDAVEQARDARLSVAPAARIDPDDMDRIREMAREAREQAETMRDQMPAVRIDREELDRIREMAQEARDRAREDMDSPARAVEVYRMAQAAPMPMPAPVPAPAYQSTRPPDPPNAPLPPAAYGVGGGTGYGVGSGFGGGSNYAFNYSYNTPMAFAQNMTIAGRRGMTDDRYYEAGQRALDNHKWDEALEDFNQVAAHAGARADAGYFWKAYTLNKLGRRDEAVAAIAELRKSYASSRWLDDAKALEIEVKQKSGTPVSPETESDEELKLMALNGIMQSDPERAIPLVENILKGSASPRLKRQALFVLAQSSQPKAQQVIEQIARGGANPDLQVKAIESLSNMRRRQTNNSQNQLFQEIYNSTSDLNVKRAILNAYRNTHDTDRLLQIAKAEKVGDLRVLTFNQLGESVGQPELWQIYQAETSPEMKIEILRVMHQNGNADKLAEVVRNEKDPKVRRAALDALSDQRTTSGDQLVTLYTTEQDPQFKQVIIDRLSGERNAKRMVDLAKAEKDPKMKLKIVERLSNMHSKEASDYLLELLK